MYFLWYLNKEQVSTFAWFCYERRNKQILNSVINRIDEVTGSLLHHHVGFKIEISPLIKTVSSFLSVIDTLVGTELA